MVSKKIVILRAAAVFVCIVLPPLTAYAEDDCASGAHIEQVQCESHKIELARENLERTYQKTLAGLPEHDSSDERKSKEQLVKAQKAWEDFVRENCAYVGGVQGGSNLWVTEFSGICELDEINKRIYFFQHPPTQ